MITVNIFFACWITDIDIRRYPDDTRILPTNNNIDVCQFAASQLKYLPKDSIKTIENQVLYSNTELENSKIWYWKKIYFRIPLGILLDLGLINFSMKTDTKFSFTLQENMNKIFESKKNIVVILLTKNLH